ncbi:transmembrane sensor [Parabacteroides sp. PF5-5]|uniref:FecR domain-containing protein n=1 Tax=unclassified Parabacteroides TaxID=2649774 RepID=UPI0024746240|nr:MULTISPECIES: FecR domain-containing protein [unclassified Parabacteroides]MDH6303941.1 transmembrane sensor [Parabacteroides sp. PH5-39]MDH6314558.1 transmembrane sensor [Parabacteroides sp. PF5-13]MDH6318377.1 transmembrane sensor [Parabacteroides sp. PH5-13]MDH6322330.1 transmembrane sensor [Parabacteroides sp. PH5-8]MDH6325590.1 transmembrane sensor [Parabacteroides sp. PH5-41]
MKDEKVDALLLAYFSGQLTDAERQELVQWLNENEANKERLTDMADWWAMAHVPFYESGVKTDFEKHFADLLTPAGAVRKQGVFRRSLWGKIAAAVLLLLMTSVSFYYVGKGTSAASDEMAHFETEVPYGSQVKLTLPDHSIVWLNAGSSLKYRENRIESRREVTLNGEAYFEVARDTLKPFIVSSGNLDIKVLGTSFNVRAYDNDESVDVALVSGRVNVFLENTGEKSNENLLIPNQMLTYNKTTNDIQIAEVKSEDYSAWKDGKVRFTEEPFARIAKTLERKYNIQIMIESDFLKKEIFSGSFTNNYSFYDILNEVDVDKKYVWLQKGNSFIIKDK